jgi:hypothetical protein
LRQRTQPSRGRSRALVARCCPRRICVLTKGGLAYSDSTRFVALPGVPSEDVFSITGDEAGNLWRSGNRGLTHLLSVRIGEHFRVQ